MSQILEYIPLANKTTLQIGGQARYFAELKTKQDMENAFRFAEKKKLPIVILGAGSNTIFADGIIEALVVHISANAVTLKDNIVTVESGMYLAQLLQQCAEHDLDLSPLTGIPGTVGGALFGNAGQGFDGMWIGSFVESVEIFEDGTFKTLTKEKCEFGYRTSIFKTESMNPHYSIIPLFQSPIIWSSILSIPTQPQKKIELEISRILKHRTETQPHRKTAGSCFLSQNKDQPAWKLIDAAGLRGHQIGGMKISKKHANFLMNEGGATFEDAKNLVKHIQKKMTDPLSVEMRFIGEDGLTAF